MVDSMVHAMAKVMERSTAMSTVWQMGMKMDWQTATVRDGLKEWRLEKAWVQLLDSPKVRVLVVP